MARIHNLRDTEDKDLTEKFFHTDLTVSEWFSFSTDCSKEYSLQQATLVLVEKLRSRECEFFTVTNINDTIFFEGTNCYGWALSQEANFLIYLLAEYPVVAFHSEDGNSIFVEKIDSGMYGKYYTVRD